MNYSEWLSQWDNLCRARDVMIDGKQGIVLRHDIDSFTDRVKRVANIEEAHGVRSSWYVIVDPSYRYYERQKKVFKELESRGHEIGLHVNSVELSHAPRWKGRSKENAVLQLGKDIAKIKKDFDVVTMCAHGIDWPYTNKDLLRDFDSEIIAFNRFFDDRDCIFTDSRGWMSTAQKKEGYIVMHPQTLDKRLRFPNKRRTIESLSDKELKRLV